METNSKFSYVNTEINVHYLQHVPAALKCAPVLRVQPREIQRQSGNKVTRTQISF